MVSGALTVTWSPGFPAAGDTENSGGMQGGGARMFRQLVAPTSTGTAHIATAKPRAQAPVSECPRIFPMTRLSRQRRGYGSTAGLRKHALVTEDDDGGGAAGRGECYVFGE